MKKDCTCERYSFGLICPSCSNKQEVKKSSLPFLKETFHLKDYGKISRARYDEIGRRVLVPDGRGGEVLRRMGENGKIQDRVPDYY